LHGARFTPSSLVKTWVRELKAFKDQGQLGFDDAADGDANIATEIEGSDPEAALVPILGYNIESMASLQYLQASFQTDPSIENLQALIVT
jgi:hypothetical protein